MKLSEALKATMNEFGLTGTDLVESARITHSRLSRFLGGTAIKTDGLDQVLEALDDDALGFMMEKLIESRGLHVVAEKKPTFSALVERLDEAETAELLNALAEKIKKGPTAQGIRKRELVTT
jgi:transcriptional regulator with XRE-family HTH domain